MLRILGYLIVLLVVYLLGAFDGYQHGKRRGIEAAIVEIERQAGKD